MTTTKIYKGELQVRENCEYANVLYLFCKRTGDSEILSELIHDDIDQYGHWLSVRYFVSKEARPVEEMKEEWILKLCGYGDARYDMYYSEYTGYLWTDDIFSVGGHDLNTELSFQEGKYLWLEIKYDDKPKER